MIKAIVLCHPGSKVLLPNNTFNSEKVSCVRVACGTTKPKQYDLSESNDFWPTYASLNSALFETSVIMTIWEHADQIVGPDHICILHTDVIPHYKANVIWEKLDYQLTNDCNRPIGITVSNTYSKIWKDWSVPDNALFRPAYDPMKVHAFDDSIHVWDYIKKYDYEIYEWAFDANPLLIYSHQFACSRTIFDQLGSKLYHVINKLKLSDIGLWTPHMFERLIALYLAKLGDPILTTAFWHYSSSGTIGPGEYNLYGPRALKYYKTFTRWNMNLR